MSDFATPSKEAESALPTYRPPPVDNKYTNGSNGLASGQGSAIDDMAHNPDSESGAITTDMEKQQLADEELARRMQAEWNEQDQDEPQRSVAPPPMPPPVNDTKGAQQNGGSMNDEPPQYAPPAGRPPANRNAGMIARHHTNAVIEAAKVRARDEVRS